MIKTRMAACVAVCAIASCGAAHAQSNMTKQQSSSKPLAEQNYLRFGTSERNVTIAPFIQFDIGSADADPYGAFGTDLDRDTDFRRARIYASFDYDAFGGLLTVDFANDDAPLTYLFVNYDITDELTVQLGQQDEPFSLEDMIGSRSETFAEAGLNAALVPANNVGAALIYGTDHYSLSGGVFFADLNHDDLGRNGTGVTGRATFAPIATDDEVIHFGLGMTYRDGFDNTTSYGGGSGSYLVKPTPISTGTFADPGRYFATNFEFAAERGRFSLQSEFTVAEQDDGMRGDSTLYGGYVFAAAFLTDDTRPYSAASGSFGKVDPTSSFFEGGTGAVQVGARLSFLDLDDAGGSAGREVAVSGVANWYLSSQIRVTGDVTHTEVTSGPRDDSSIDAAVLRLSYIY
ncbi:OprO/OprP family phosphate-selective porin [Pararhizobium mangrovi]|nr:porin [Pararhizobium mangrovi]